MKRQEAIMLYEGDCWLTNSSLVLMGVFTNQKKLRKAIKDLVRDQLNRHLFLDGGQKECGFFGDVCHEVLTNGQFSGCDASICIKKIELNQFEEI